VSTYQDFLARTSFIEMNARERARSILDPGTFHELLGPFDRIKSPWLPLQDIVAQADDGVVLARGRLDGHPAVIAAIESAFQGGSLGEVSGAKIAGALELALRDCERGHPVVPVLLLETGGVRLQEANLGLAAIADIHAAIIALRRHVPVIGVVAGPVGCFGGMSLAAALCSWLIVTRQSRLGMNGPEVIEQEAGVAELDASDRKFVWSLIGGQPRFDAGLADDLLEDDATAISTAVRSAITRGVPDTERSSQITHYIDQLSLVSLPFTVDVSTPADSPSIRHPPASRALTWLRALTGDDGLVPDGPPSVRVAHATLGDSQATFIAVVPDPTSRFPRARHGEVGLDEGWALARQVRAITVADRDRTPRPIIAIVDVPSQAYGRLEEQLGIHLACAAAVDAYASARLAGHPVIALLVGKAMSGAFLAHGYQANRILALDSPEVQIQAMGKQAAARITRRSVADLDALGLRIPPMAYDVHAFASLGLLHTLIEGVNADAPTPADVVRVRRELLLSIKDVPPDLSSRLASPLRAASLTVRRRLAEQWDA
jgi:malonate decarboxylase beta subunit